MSGCCELGVLERYKVALLDLDDCILETSKEVFYPGFEMYLARIREVQPNLDPERLAGDWRAANVDKYRQVGVRRDRWDVAVEALAERYPKMDRIVFFEPLPILAEEMYKLVPSFCDGAEEALQLLKAAGLTVVVVSNGDYEWTNYKIERSGAGKYIDEVVCADPVEYWRKEVGHWEEGLRRAGGKVETAMGAGDNKITDVGELWKLGVRTLAYVRGIWSVYGEGGLPEGVPTLKSLGRWPKYLEVCESRGERLSLGK